MRTLQLAIAVCLSFTTFGYASSADTDDKSIVMNMVTNISESSWNAMEPQYKDTDNNELVTLCEELGHLEEVILIVNNATKLAEVEKEEKLTPEQVTKLKEEAANAKVKVNELKSNTTLVKECLIVEAHLKLLHECKEIVVLILIVDIANNHTLLLELEEEAKHNLTDAQDVIVKELAANATTELATFEKNTTLITDCKTLLNITLKLNTMTTATTTATTTAKTTATTTAKTTSTTTAKTMATITATTTAKLTSSTRPSTITISVKATSIAAASLSLTKPSTTSTSANKLNVSTTTSKILHNIQIFYLLTQPQPT